MKIISHRGNLEGPQTCIENHPDSIIKSQKKFFVEVDIWLINKKIYLGHDNPEFQYDLNKFNLKKIFFHAKNIDCLDYLNRNNLIYFCHDTDDFSFVQNLKVKTLWGFKDKLKKIKNFNIIIVDNKFDNLNFNGICTDYPLKLKKKIIK